MKTYPTDRIRTIAIMGHSGAGKTSFGEACFFNAKVIDRLGKVEDGTALLDFDPEEKKRKISINMSVASLEWDNKKFNLLDTPGDFDFIAETESALRAADSALIVISAKSGVTVGAEKAVRYLRKEKLPFAFFINKMDDEKADYQKVMDQLRSKFGTRVTPMMVPILKDGKMTGFVNSFNCHAHLLHPNGDLEDCELPQDMVARLDEIRESMVEHVAESAESLMDKYFAGESFTDDEIYQGIFEAVENADVYPVFCGSALRNWGVRYTLSKLGDYMPSPVQARLETLKYPDGSEKDVRCTNLEGEAVAVVFKTLSDPFVGKISYSKIISGTLKNGMVLYNSNTEKEERVTGLSVPLGGKMLPADECSAGDICAMLRLSDTFTGDTLSSPQCKATAKGVDFPPVSFRYAVYPLKQGDEDKILSGLKKLHDEDPSFCISTNPETHEVIIGGVGEIHLSVIKSKLRNKYKVDCELREPRVPYRETIRKSVKVQGKHKKQSGGHGQYGDVWIEFEPCDSDGIVFEDKVFGGAVPKNFFPAVEKGLQEASQKGVLAGYPVVGVKATLVDGSYHDVDSSEMAFKLAAHIAYKEGMKQASPQLLEPVDKVTVRVPENHTGDVMSDLIHRRGRICGIGTKNEMQVITAEVPESELMRYATDLRSMTQGRAWFGSEFLRYEICPENIADKVIKEFSKND